MSIAGKIEKLVNGKNYASFNDLIEQFDENKVKQQMFEYGVKHPKNLICSVIAEHKTTKQIIAGMVKMSEVLLMDKSENIDISSLIPIAILTQDYDIQKYLQFQYQQKIITKTGSMKYHKPLLLPSFLVQQNNAKIAEARKKFSKNKSVANNDKKTNTKQNLQKDKQLVKNTQKQKQKQRIKQKQKQKLKQKQKQIKTQTKKQPKKAIIAKQQEDSFEEEIKKYEILPNTQSEQNQIKNIPKSQSTYKEEVKIQEQRKEIVVQAKVSDLDDDDLEAFEKLLKNKKKPENVNINLPNKTEKRTTQKVIQKAKPRNEKPVDANPKNKGTLLTYLVKNK